MKFGKRRLASKSVTGLPNRTSKQVGRGAVWKLLKGLKGSPTGISGLIILLFWIFIAILGPVLAPHQYTTFHPADGLQPPSLKYICGTDQYGRDMFSRIVMGSQSILTVAIGVAFISTALGILIGFLAGYFGGLVDEVIMRFMDILMSIPTLLLAMVILGILVRPGVGSLIFIIALVFSPRTARVSRSELLRVKTLEFIDASRVRGESYLYTIFREIFPNTLGPIIVEGTARFAYAIRAVASLGFLGIGLQPPASDWGFMIAENKSIIFCAPWAVLFPGLAIASLIIGVSLFADFLNQFLSNL